MSELLFEISNFSKYLQRDSDCNVPLNMTNCHDLAFSIRERIYLMQAVLPKIKTDIPKEDIISL